MRRCALDLELNGKTAIVTGGSRGIGKAVAAQLMAEGVDVALAARDEATLAEAVRELSARSDRRVLGLGCDTGDDAAVRGMVERVLGELGRIDILVNCAAKPGGQAAPPGMDAITDELFWEDMNVKVMGYLRCARAVAPQMRAQGWGRIINVSGLAARQSGSMVGSMRNVAVSALTKNLADELGRDGINVTVVHPGLTVTERTPEVLAARAARTGRAVEELRREMFESNTIRRAVEARDVADVVVFLASPRSVAISGDAIAVGGGVGRAIFY